MHQHPTYFKLHNSMQSAGQEGSRWGSSRDPQGAWPEHISQSGPAPSGQGQPQTTLRAQPLPWAHKTAVRGNMACAPSFLAVKSPSMAKMGGPSRNLLSLEDRSLLRAGTDLGLMAEAVPWSHMLLPPTAGRQGRGRGAWEPLLRGC